MKAENNPFPSVLFDEQGSDPATPDTGSWRVYAKSDGLYIIDDAGAVTGPFIQSAGGLGSWTSFTPTWTTTGTAPSLGNGTLVGRYKQLDASTYLIRIHFIAGSTTTFGTGAWSFALPVTASASGEQIMAAHILDSGTDNKLAVAFINASATKISQIVPEGGTAVDNGSPMTWANGDRLNIEGFLEV